MVEDQLLLGGPARSPDAGISLGTSACRPADPAKCRGANAGLPLVCGGAARVVQVKPRWSWRPAGY